MDLNLGIGCDVKPERGLLRSPTMTTTKTCRYRGYDIVPMRQWSSWCVGVYSTRADLPLFSRSTLHTLSQRREDAVAEAKQSIDRVLSSQSSWLT